MASSTSILLINFVTIIKDTLKSSREMKKRAVLEGVDGLGYEPQTSEKKNSLDDYINEMLKGARLFQGTNLGLEKLTNAKSVNTTMRLMLKRRSRDLNKILELRKFCLEQLPFLQKHVESVVDLETLYKFERDRLKQLKTELIAGLVNISNRMEANTNNISYTALSEAITTAIDSKLNLNLDYYQSNVLASIRQLITLIEQMEKTKNMPKASSLRDELITKFGTTWSTEILVYLCLFGPPGLAQVLQALGGIALNTIAVGTIAYNMTQLMAGSDDRRYVEAAHEAVRRAMIDGSLSKELAKRYTGSIKAFVNGWYGLKLADRAMEEHNLSSGDLTRILNETIGRMEYTLIRTEKALKLATEFYDKQLKLLKEHAASHGFELEDHERSYNHPFYSVLSTILKYHDDYKGKMPDAIKQTYMEFTDQKQNFFKKEIIFFDQTYTILDFAIRVPLISYKGIDVTFGAGIKVDFNVKSGGYVTVKNIFHSTYNLTKPVISAGVSADASFGVFGFVSAGLRFFHLINAEAQVGLALKLEASLGADLNIYVSSTSPILEGVIKGTTSLTLVGKLRVELNLGSIARVVASILQIGNGSGGVGFTLDTCPLIELGLNVESRTKINLDKSTLDSAAVRKIFKETMKNTDKQVVMSGLIVDKVKYHWEALRESENVDAFLTRIEKESKKLKLKFFKGDDEDSRELFFINEKQINELNKRYNIEIPRVKRTVDLSRVIQERLSRIEAKSQEFYEDLDDDAEDWEFDISMAALKQRSKDMNTDSLN